MTTKLQAVLVGLAGLVLVGLAVTATAGAHPADFAEDPVSTVGHVCDQWGIHNDWGTHQHGDHWTDHPHHDGTAGHHHDGTGGQHHGGAHGPHGDHHGFGHQ